MPANLPPQYHSVEAKLKEAKTPEDKISIYEELLSMMPKHKGTEKLQKDLKTKIAKLRKQGKKKSRKELFYHIDKEGASQVAITGPINSGKSSLLNALTNAKAKTSPYPFTTKIPQLAMMPYEDILIQLIDTPPLTKDFSPGWLKDILKKANVLLIICDVSKMKEMDDFIELLKTLKIEHKKTLIVGNKVDLFKLINIPNVILTSCMNGAGLEDLKQKILNLAEVIRVYTKSPNKPADIGHPFTLNKGSRLMDLASQIHFDLVEKFKYARLFKIGSKRPRIIGKEYILEDKDIVEIHSN